ncbi:ABC transporter permease subunit [Ligilactobacillus apodemi]|uniref:ABC transporter permease subunit n=1 Tax=Ligilactobacillus apodemi TaxID=307126 RepID=UPI00214AABDA|nr:ABC transporter permease subunit [Ligilactobacillus apodemi]MCR1902227.1 ABC transporter permease subunit [Ligilactobacillus apodemi]
MKEVFKAVIFRFFKSKVWLFYLVIMSVISLFLITSISEKNHTEWKNELSIENMQLAQQKDHSEKIYTLNNIYLRKDVQPPTSNTFTGYLSSVLSLRGLGLLIVIFPIVIAAEIAKDFESKRLNLILTSPVTRNEYFYGRLLSVLAITVLLLTCIFTVNLFIAFFYFRDTSVYDVVYYIKGERIFKSNGLKYILSNIL